MGKAHITAVGQAHPPDVDHRVIGSPLIFQIVENTGHVRVTIVTADVVHPLGIGLISLLDGLIVLFWGDVLELKNNIFVSLSKGKIIN